MEASVGSFRTRRSFPFASRLRLADGGFACHPATSLAPTLPAVGSPSSLRHSFTAAQVQESLPVVHHLPRADEPSSGNLGFSVRGILTHVPLLTPAFSLPCSPHLLPVMLLRTWNAPLPSLGIHSFGSMLSPGILSAQSHSTSELLRTL